MAEFEHPCLSTLKEIRNTFQLIKLPTKGRNSEMKQQAIIQMVSRMIWINLGKIPNV